MLSETKQNLQEIVNKIQVLDYVIETSSRTHKDHLEKAETFLKRASTHKVKLIEEVLRLSGVE